MDINYDFSDQCGIITGAASGIGKALALLLAESNAGLSLVDRDGPGLDTIARACRKTYPVAPQAVHADVSKENDVRRMVEQTLLRFGKIDFLVTSAGILYRTEFTGIPLEEWDEVMDTNVRGVFICNQFVVREMLKSKKFQSVWPLQPVLKIPDY